MQVPKLPCGRNARICLFFSATETEGEKANRDATPSAFQQERGAGVLGSSQLSASKLTHVGAAVPRPATCTGT